MTTAAPTRPHLIPPGPRNHPIIGNLGAFRRDAPGFLLETARTYGDIAFFRLGSQRVYLLNHPDHIRDVLVTRQHDFTKSRMLQRSKVLLGEGLLTSEAPHHTRQRRMVQPAFHRERLAGYGQTMAEYAGRRREAWQDGQPLDMDQEMMRLTLAVVAKTLFNADVEAEAAEIGEALTQVLELFRIVNLPFSSLLQKLPVPPTLRFQRAKARLDQTIYRIISERRASGEDKGDLLSMLMMARDEAGTGGMSDQQVRDEALTLFLAGHETTAVALTWTWYLLSQHPDIESRFHAELKTVLGGRLPSPMDIPSLRYTEMVFTEAMRLYPPAWAIGRMARTEHEVAGYVIPPRGIVLMSPYVTHHDPRWYPDPDRFDPSRWTPEERAKRPRFAYFPFGGGARVCVGEPFAWMEGILLLAAIGQRWRFELAHGHPVGYRALITLRTRHGMRMIPRLDG